MLGNIRLRSRIEEITGRPASQSWRARYRRFEPGIGSSDLGACAYESDPVRRHRGDRPQAGIHQFVIEKKVSAGMDTLNAPPTTEISAPRCKFNEELVW